NDRDTYYDKLVTGLVARRDKHQAQVYCDGPWKIRKNDKFDVAARPSGVRVCWFYNSTAAAWEHDLKDESLRLMVQGKDKTKEGKHFENFPWLKTFGQNSTTVIKLSTAQVNLLSNLTAWIVASDDTQKLIRDHLTF